MGTLRVFNFVTLNGFFEAPNKDISWAHEKQELGYAEEMLAARDTLLIVHPLALGDGTPFLKGLKRRLNLKPTKTRNFKSGTVLLCYEPAEVAARSRETSDFQLQAS